MNSPSQSAMPSQFIPKSITSEIREGDWDAYQRHSKNFSKVDFVTGDEGLIVFRRKCCLAYLGKRAQFYGGTCGELKHRIFTPNFVVELGNANENRRFIRYPWLGKLVDLIAEIEREQAQATDPYNVISLASVTK